MWNKAEHQAKMQTAVSKLLAQLTTQGITFNPTDGGLENIILTQGDKVVKMSHHSFYRYSGQSKIYITKEKDPRTEILEMTDEMYLQNIIKPVIEILFASI